MSRVPRPARGPIALALLVMVAVVLAIPVLAASPSPSGGPGNGNGSGKGPKASHEPEVQVTLKGSVSATTSTDGSVDYTLTANGKTLKLEAGPTWFWGDKNPLKAYVGKTVTVVGEQSGDEVDVISVDGTAIRAAGKPPWAGGWKVVGKTHPGWSQEKADRMKAKFAANGGCWPPGHCKGPRAEASAAP
jgi:hypothetical protein